ncbi:MAG: hypothetical protein UU35_C0018G0012 [Candidatus Uhrbacteria bacterium GW2011_GWC2_41_11]|uniref:Uncharacterized protein n=1 Tax=Candidatus Uhrbacteria bacterium GW2011_GWC2_41_11 TaxID=1618985 RepID=A0A0G0UFH0_9BACT|nr:MAG: hypothetical protein UU35_C0018G0012 [Candidatus Uhrbacteria bacterium GW2011_GWC2_41_11]HBP00570.1 hypothetical protein [Candidatus Uhrbacteria bacterium]
MDYLVKPHMFIGMETGNEFTHLQREKKNSLETPEEWRRKEGKTASDFLISLYETYFFAFGSYKEEWKEMKKACHKIESVSPTKAAEFFDIQYTSDFGKIAEGLKCISESSILQKFYDNILDQFSGHVLRLFVLNILKRKDDAESFFNEKYVYWSESHNDNYRGWLNDILQEFFVGPRTVSDLVVWTLAESSFEEIEHSVSFLDTEETDHALQISSDAAFFIPNWTLMQESLSKFFTPSQEREIRAVQMEVPMPDRDPWWYEMRSRPVLSDDEEDNDDDKDFSLLNNVKRYEKEETPMKLTDLARLFSALKEENSEAIGTALEHTLARGPIPAEKKKFIIDGLQMVAAIYGWKGGQIDPSLVSFQKKLKQLQEDIPIPVSADSIEVTHQQFKKKRTIEAYPQTLHRRMLEIVVSLFVDEARQNRNNKESVIQALFVIEQRARSLYAEVVEKGVPAFREYIHWLNEQSRQVVEDGEPHPGEFYVGRDTLTTLYPAANAFRWGKMTGAERRRLTVFVNVSRPLIQNMRSTHEMRMIMKDWLEKEGVTRSMFGIDGGYTGSSPYEVFKALDSSFTQDKGDRQIRLLNTSNENRRTISEDYFDIVEWMEMLPKFTDRAQRVLATEFGKYYVKATRRSSVERILAWTVQHAVWREMINDNSDFDN